MQEAGGEGFSLVDQDFSHRVGLIPSLGFGLSVDVYSPDLFDLVERFETQKFQPDYLEIFRASTTALETVRRQYPAIPLAYHGEGLWVTQPDFPDISFLEREIGEVAGQLAVLGSPWLNHECAAKQMAGYSFGTYLPPLYTEESARVTADNIRLVQESLDNLSRSGNDTGPLFLLELSPLTYFMAGTLPIPQFFQSITDHVPCGLVLDIGHLWTIYRYSNASQRSSLERFIEEFMEEFPVERIVQIHVAGLAFHDSASRRQRENGLPVWIDAHAAPIPEVSWTVLEQVLSHPGLINLRGVALEVDTKPIEHIVEEFQKAGERFGRVIEEKLANGRGAVEPARQRGMVVSPCASKTDRQHLQEAYIRYAQIISGRIPPSGSDWQRVVEDRTGLDWYVLDYLPYEIFHWGGEISEMFPDTCRALSECGMTLDGLFDWWFQSPRPLAGPYDFFLLKIERVLDFVAEQAPGLLAPAEREAKVLREAYSEANDLVRPEAR